MLALGRVQAPFSPPIRMRFIVRIDPCVGNNTTVRVAVHPFELLKDSLTLSMWLIKTKGKAEPCSLVPRWQV